VTEIRLVPLAEPHLEGLAAILADDAVLRFTRIPVPVPAGFERRWLEAYERGRADGTREAFAILDAAGDFAGVALAPRIAEKERTAELGYVVAPAARGRGVATAALRALTQWAFSELGAIRLELLISVENHASKRVAERAGYVREGVLRSLWVKDGVREDTEIWSRLTSDA
jgi:RimJ/RimL family protein N-acetyltransferase